jgi:hypothetical protein
MSKQDVIKLLSYLHNCYPGNPKNFGSQRIRQAEELKKIVETYKIKF